MSADDITRINQLKEEVAKMEASLKEKGIKISVIQKLIQLAKELIAELEM